jgi:DNA-binding transcriptional MerR regulator
MQRPRGRTPSTLNGKGFYLAQEAAEFAGVSKATLLRWIARKLVDDAAKRDRNGWRLFSVAEVEALKRFAETGKKDDA